MRAAGSDDMDDMVDSPATRAIRCPSFLTHSARTRLMKRQLLAVLLCVVLTTVSHAQEDHFFAQRISHVEWSGGNEPPLRLIGPWDLVDRPYVVVPGGEAYLVHLGRHPLPNAELEANPPRRELNDNDAWLVAVRSPKKEVTGTLYSPRELRDG